MGGDYRGERCGGAIKLRYVPGGTDEFGAARDVRAYRGERCGAGRDRGAGIAGDCAGLVQCNFCGDREADSELAKALQSTKSVVAAVGLFGPDESLADHGAAFQSGQMSFAPAPSSIIWPIAGIQNSAHVGLVNIATDHAGVPRYVPMIYRDGNSVVPSFVLAASAAALNTEAVLGETSLKLAARTAQLDLGHHL